MPYRHNVTWLIIFGVIALMFLQLPHLAARQDAILRTYAALVEVDALAKQKYVEPVEGARLVDGAIRGLLRQLDPYSAYIAPHQMRVFEEQSRGAFTGVGVELAVRGGRIIVIAPVEGGPAVRAGILPGDVIITINGYAADGLSLFDVETMLETGTNRPVTLQVEREGRRDPLTLTIQPGPITLHTVRGFSRQEDGDWRFIIDDEPGIAYVRVSAFLENTMLEFREALRAVQQAGARAMVLDLRFNPGGLMNQAVDMADCFLEGGLILATVSRRHAEQEYFAKGEGTIDDLSLAVLINGSSASSAEIVAGALQDHDRAVIIGERSFGKGSVQRLIHLTESEGAVKLTTAYYRLPRGRMIHRMTDNPTSDDWGIKPDVSVAISPEEVDRIQACRRRLDVPVGEVEAQWPRSSKEEAGRVQVGVELSEGNDGRSQEDARQSEDGAARPEAAGIILRTTYRDPQLETAIARLRPRAAPAD